MGTPTQGPSSQGSSADADEPIRPVPAAAELERSIASVHGVATVEVSRSAEGRDRLQITLTPGADPESASLAVAATLRERFGIALDPASIRARPTLGEPDPATTAVGDPLLAPADHRTPALAPATAFPGTAAERLSGDPDLVAAARAAMDSLSPTTAGAGAAAPPVGPAVPPSRARRRAAIRELVALPDGEDVTVLATLRLADQEVVGRARGLDTRRGRWRTIAEATLGAVNELTDGRLRVEVDHVTVLAFPDLAHVTVAVTVIVDRVEERFLGAAMVRDDPDRAVMRASLDAVNRRVECWLAEGPLRSPAGHSA